MKSKGTLFTVSAPSGAGKTSLVKALVDSLEAIKVSVSHTTRVIRPGETNGVNYHFIDEPAFLKMVNQAAFLEHAKVFSNYYGTSSVWVEEQLNNGIDVVLEIDWQGAAQIRKLIPSAVAIFILPPSQESLELRLKDRAQDSADVIALRMAEAKSEIEHYVESDYFIVNDSFDKALEEFRALVIATRLRTTKQQQKHQALLQSLLS